MLRGYGRECKGRESELTGPTGWSGPGTRSRCKHRVGVGKGEAKGHGEETSLVSRASTGLTVRRPRGSRGPKIARVARGRTARGAAERLCACAAPPVRRSGPRTGGSENEPSTSELRPYHDELAATRACSRNARGFGSRAAATLRKPAVLRVTRRNISKVFLIHKIRRKVCAYKTNVEGLSGLGR